MKSASSRVHDQRRLQTLRRYDVFNEPQIDSLEALLGVVAEVTGVANVVINIIDDTQQIPLAHVGNDVAAVPVDEAMCHAVIDSGALIHADDAAADSRFSGSSFTAGASPAVRLYASAPLRADTGDIIGTLCVYDDKAGSLSDEQRAMLQVLADHVMQLLQLGLAQRRLREELMQSAGAEQRQRNLLEASPDAFIRTTDDTTIVTWSPSATRLFGYTSAEAVGQRVIDLLLPESERAEIGGRLNALTGSGLVTLDSQRISLVRGDGEERCYHVTPWLDSSAGQVFINCFARDITDEETAARRVEEAELRWRLAFEAAPIGMALQRIDGRDVRYEQVNQALCDMTGYSLAELLELGPRGITHPDDRAQDSALLAVRSEWNQLDRAKRYIHADGHTIHVRVSSVVAGGTNPQDHLVVTQIQDVTKLHETMVSLQEKAALLDLTKEAVFVRRIDGTVVFWNKGAEELYGIPASRALGRVTHHLLETEFPEDFDVIRKKLLEDGRWEGLLKHTDVWGNRRIVMSRWAHNVDELGEEVILEINSDVTSAHEAEARRRTAEALFEIAFTHAPNGVGVIGAANGTRGRWLQANEALRELTPVRRDPVGEPVAAMFDPEDAPQVMRQLGELFSGRQARWTGEWRVPTRGGGHRYLAAQCIAIAREDTDGERIVVVQLEDITRRRAHENWLLGQAVQDSLTELPNRLAINELLESEISSLADHGQPLAVLFIDLDGFKAVNDRFGHAAGDGVLVEVARRLRDNAPENATVGRLGGDEFVVLAPGHDEAAAAKLSRILRETTMIPAGEGPDALVVTASIGWASTADPSTASGALLGRADSMMYDYKNANRRAPGPPTTPAVQA